MFRNMSRRQKQLKINNIFIPQAIVEHGGALVESIAFNRRVVGSTPALAAM